MKYDYILRRSRRKSISIEVNKKLEIIVRAPLFVRKRDIDLFVYEKSDWIEEAINKVEARRAASNSLEHLTTEDVQELAKQAKKVIPLRVAYFADILGLEYGRISIRSQRTRWGSCSAKGNLNFNCLLMLVPEEIMDYVVVHELCHLIELNHSAAFWAEVERVLPDYKERRKWLKQNGSALIESLPS